MAAKSWKNWSGSVVCNPTEVLFPKSEAEIVNIVNRAKNSNKLIRVVGTGHSFTQLVHTNEILLSLDQLQGLISIDRAKNEAEVWAGTKIRALGELLFQENLAQENLGDVDVQSIAGSIMTGTHGTGIELGNLATQVVGLTMVNGKGELITLSGNDNDHLFKATLISLGSIGIVTRYKLALQPSYKLEMVMQKAQLDEVLININSYTSSNRNFEIFSFLYSDKVQIRLTNTTEKPVKKDGFGRYVNEILLENYFFWGISEITRLIPGLSAKMSALSASAISEMVKINHSHRIYATKRLVKFNEMEYNVPYEAYPEVVKAIYQLNEKKQFRVHFPLEHRFVKGDDIWLSPAYQRTSAYIAIHVYKGKSYHYYFREMEALFRDFDGRPHWGKMHFLDADQLAASYPKWEAFHELRKENDPEGVFLNDYLKLLFGQK
ncbi:MAG: D-arabinono-1,4-lactone oxidase [Bacteroidota bacterium]